MKGGNGYAVFFFPQALEAIGAPIQPYLQGEGEAAHVVCREIDTGGALIEMTLDARTPAGEALELELMVPSSMVRMIVSARAEEAGFGFGPRSAAAPAAVAVANAAAAEVPAVGAALPPPGSAASTR